MSKRHPNRTCPTDALLSMQEVCDRMTTSPKVVRRLVRQGKLSAIKLGKTTPLRFRPLDVARCIEAHMTPGAPAAGEARSMELPTYPAEAAPASPGEPCR